MKKVQIDRELIFDFISENKWIKYGLYAGGTILGIWILGKGSRLLTSAIINFKSLRDAIRG